MTLPTCSRTGDIIEPMLKEQWFVDAAKIFKICGDSVRNKRLKLIASFRENLWNHYATEFTKKDWCISRQLVWGQQIAAYKCTCEQSGESKWFSAHSKEEALTKASKHFGSTRIKVQQGKSSHSFIFFIESSTK